MRNVLLVTVLWCMLAPFGFTGSALLVGFLLKFTGIAQ